MISDIPDDYLMIIWWYIWWLSDDYLMIIWWLSDDYLMIIWWLSDDYLMHDYLMIIWWLSISSFFLYFFGAVLSFWRSNSSDSGDTCDGSGGAVGVCAGASRQRRTDSKGMPRDPWHIVTHRDTPRHLASDAMTATLGTFGRCTLPRYPLGSDMVRHSQIRVCPLSAPLERQSSLETWGFRNLATKNFLLASFPHGHGIETNRPCIVRHQQQT